MIDLLFRFADNLTAICPHGCGLPNINNAPNNSTVHSIIQIALGVLGGIALLVIVIAGLRYITSAGDAQKAAGARNTIIYALVGLVIAISAEAILTFILNGVG